MSILDQATKNQKAAQYDEMMRKQEVVNAYKQGGNAVLSQQAAAQYANDLMKGMAGQAAEQAQRDRMKGDMFAEYSNGKLGFNDLVQSGQFTNEELGQIRGINTNLSNTQNGLAGMNR